MKKQPQSGSQNQQKNPAQPQSGPQAQQANDPAQARSQAQQNDSSMSRSSNQQNDASTSRAQSEQNTKAGTQSPELKNKIKQEWSELTDADIDLYINGKEEQFFNNLEEKCNVSQDEARRKINQLQSASGSSNSTRKTA